MGKTKTFDENIFRNIALIISIIGFIGSLCFLLKTGRNQSSILLTTLFIIWVLTPFLGLFFANKTSTNWRIDSRKLFYWFTVILTIVSLIAYSGLLTPQKKKSTFLFLSVPLISLLFIIIFITKVRKLKDK